MTSPLLIRGMHGLGDNIHQRAVIRALLKRDHRIALETSWPCVYHDLAGENLSFIRKPVALRTQLKNAAREAHKFAATSLPHHPANSIQISYGRTMVTGSPSRTVLEAMFMSAGIRDDFADADFRLPIPPEWEPVTFETTKPVMIYRPLVVRPEFRGSGIRNANVGQYAELIAMVRDSFFVVSLADLESNREWIVGPQLIADATYNHGELPFERMAATVAKAQLVFTSGGFLAVLGLAVGTPTVSIVGGYEPASWVSAGSKFTPYLGVQPINPCQCATSGCGKPCAKTLDMPHARGAILEFLTKLGISAGAESRPASEIFSPPTEQPPQPRSNPVGPRRMPQLRVGHPSLLNRRKPSVRA